MHQPEPLGAPNLGSDASGQVKPQSWIFQPGEVSDRSLPTGRFGLAIIGFTPSWFSVIMGNGIMSILIHQAPHQFKGMTHIGTALYVLNCVLFVLFLGISCARYVTYPFVLRYMLNYPPQSFFIGTMPCGLSTIVTATVYIAVPKFGTWASTLALVLWCINVVIALTTCIGLPFVMFHIHQLTLDKMTAAWLLPVVPTIVAAAAGSVVAPVVEVGHSSTVIAVCYVLLGMGMGTALFITVMYFHRLTVHHLPDREVIVSAFLPLGPLGQGAFALIHLGQAGKRSFAATGFLGSDSAGEIVLVMSVIVALMLWGMGLWWLCHGVYSVVVRRLHGRLKFNMGFWGFIFPLGVFNSATYALSQAIPSAFFSYLAMVFLVALVLLYVWVVLGTLYATYQGNLLVAPCLSDIYAASSEQKESVSLPSSRTV